MPDIIFNRTKIVATIGPASNSKEVIRDLILAGTDIFRLNFSHGEHSLHQQVIDTIRALNKELGTFVSILVDLQGPKIRIEEMQEGVVLADGQEFVLTTRHLIGDSTIASTSYKELVQDVKPGDTILIDDGNIELQVKEVAGEQVITRVIHGGPLTSRKGMNLPNTRVSAKSITDKDAKDLAFALENDVDWVALSFVRSEKDVQELKELIARSDREVRVVAKIEKPEALEHINDIIEEADAVMVARGDLGVEIDMEEVPVV
ncbi:MAG TPA: pyruvate kinase, partial [Flammeovirgaceae bacterium]|nr:pyruvate kinase [Flammeovirgaceae bacterium]